MQRYLVIILFYIACIKASSQTPCISGPILLVKGQSTGPIYLRTTSGNEVNWVSTSEQFSIGGFPIEALWGIAYNATTGNVYKLMASGNTPSVNSKLIQENLHSGAVVSKPWPFNFLCSGLTMSADGRLYSINRNNNSIVKIDFETMTLLDEFVVPGVTMGSKLTYNRPENILYTTLPGGNILQLDLNVKASKIIGMSKAANNIAYSEQTGTMFFSYSTYIAEFDLQAGSIIRQLSMTDVAWRFLSVEQYVVTEGTPAITADATAINFGHVVASESKSIAVQLKNSAADFLEISSIVSSNSAFTAQAMPAKVAPGGCAEVHIKFSPLSYGPFSGALAIHGKGVSEPLLILNLSGEGKGVPTISLEQTEIRITVAKGDAFAGKMDISNHGQEDLYWEINSFKQFKDSVRYAAGMFLKPKEYSYPSTLVAFPGAQSGNSLSVNRFIDEGNFLSTDLGGPLTYTGGKTVASDAFGPDGRYFSARLDSSHYLSNDRLFVLGAEGTINSFSITGNLSADGKGFVKTYRIPVTVKGKTYVGLYKSVSNAYNEGFEPYDESVNQLIITDAVEATHQFSENTNEQFHKSENLVAGKRLMYLLFAGAGGHLYPENDIRDMITKMVSRIPTTPSWFKITTNGQASPGATSSVEFEVDAINLELGRYQVPLYFTTNDPQKSLVAVNIIVDVSEPVGIELAAERHFRLYPNPVSDILTIEHDETINEVVLFDISGKGIYKNLPYANQTTIQMGTLPTGIYWVRVTTSQGRYFARVAKRQR
ncbi:MAG TPA: T9SS type A sorting domain-containing protein [Chryseosolibacter sp.]